MVIVGIYCGMGNQMFQYAFGKAIALRLKTRLVLDARYLNTNYLSIKRDYSLDAFSIKDALIEDIPFHKFPKKFTWYKDTRLQKYDSSIRSGIPKNSYFLGSWQSWQYFESIEPLLRKKFRFSLNFISPHIIKLSEKINIQNSVSVHIRRTDYLDNEYSYIGTLPLIYYLNAMKYIADRTLSAKFYIFSDDFQWVKTNLKVPYDIFYVENNTNIEDMFLMSKCCHHIIANSTFSWWGAWLNANPNKLVLVPEIWFVGGNTSIYQLDIIPPGWLPISIK